MVRCVRQVAGALNFLIKLNIRVIELTEDCVGHWLLVASCDFVGVRNIVFVCGCVLRECGWVGIAEIWPLSSNHRENIDKNRADMGIVVLILRIREMDESHRSKRSPVNHAYCSHGSLSGSLLRPRDFPIAESIGAHDIDC